MSYTATALKSTETFEGRTQLLHDLSILLADEPEAAASLLYVLKVMFSKLAVPLPDGPEGLPEWWKSDDEVRELLLSGLEGIVASDDFMRAQSLRQEKTPLSSRMAWNGPLTPQQRAEAELFTGHNAAAGVLLRRADRTAAAALSSDEVEVEEPLSEDAIVAIRQGIADVEAGRTLTLEESRARSEAALQVFIESRRRESVVSSSS